MDDITISDINKDDITISDINKDDIIGGTRNRFADLESDDESDDEENLLKNRFDKSSYDNFERDYKDIKSPNDKKINELVKVLITEYNAKPIIYNEKNFDKKFTIKVGPDSWNLKDVACIDLKDIETKLFEILCNNYYITDILDTRYPREKNGIDYKWNQSNVKEISVIETKQEKQKEQEEKKIEYIEKDSRKFNKYITNFIKYYKQDDSFKKLSFYKSNRKYHLLIFL